MAKKLTLAEKKMISEAVVGETKRCIAVLAKMRDVKPDLVNTAIRQIVETCPYLDFYPELKKIR